MATVSGWVATMAANVDMTTDAYIAQVLMVSPSRKAITLPLYSSAEANPNRPKRTIALRRVLPSPERGETTE
jgi:hypothetical protein